MAALDIHAVKAGFFRKVRAVNESFPDAVEIVIGNNAVGRNRCVFLENRVVVRDKRFGNAVRLGIATGVGRLHENDRFIAVCFHGGLANVLDNALESVKIILIYV